MHMTTNLNRMSAQIREWRTRIAELTRQADASGPRAGLSLRQAIDELKAKCAVTQAKIDKLKAEWL